MKRPCTAVLTVGTEITDGQITDRNSAWISRRLLDSGLDVIEHRSVPDERSIIRAALRDLASRVDWLFITGGLGPTTDDFTRNVVAEVFARPLEFDDSSWKRVNELLTSRGGQVGESQRQQCFFPQGATVLTNTAGTANAFTFTAGKVEVYVLPGPPNEIQAVWETAIASRLLDLVPEAERERLFLFRCLGRGEGDIAEITEAVMHGTGFRLGYRAHAPYVEVKVWIPMREMKSAQACLRRLQDELRPWVIMRMSLMPC